MSKVAAAARLLLSDVTCFSQYVTKVPLRAYQTAPARAVINSVLNRAGLEFLWIMPRQSGKNEAVAQVSVYLLNLLQRTGGNIVFGAIGDGTGRAATRLEERLENPWNAGHWRRAARPDRRILNNAAVVFLSTHPSAATRGETAHWLLIIDELQENDRLHLEAVFEPMRAANNATGLYIGTVRTRQDALWQKRAELERLEADGQQRVFCVTPDQVIAENPAYSAFLEAKVRKFGRNHPTIASEYFLEPIDANGGLFPPRRISLMTGGHHRQHAPQFGRIYAALIDVGGQDEQATAPGAALENPGRDYTCCTIVEIIPDGGQATYHAVDIFTDQGTRHFESSPGRPSLADQLFAYLTAWKVAHLVIDGSGIGAGLASAAAAKFGPQNVTTVHFTANSKAATGAGFLSLIETGHFQYWCDSAEYSDAWWYFTQATACTYDLPNGGAWEKSLRWSVPASHRTPTPTGPQPTHDDRLLSAALVTHLDDAWRAGRITPPPGNATSKIIRAQDPLEGLSF